MSRISPLVPPRPSKKVLEKLKFFLKKGKKSIKNNNIQKGQLYAQVSSFNIKEILKIKKNFLGLSLKKSKKYTRLLTN